MCNAVQLKVMLEVEGDVICHPPLTLTAKACLDCAVLLLHVISPADHMSDFSVPSQFDNFAVQL